MRVNAIALLLCAWTSLAHAELGSGLRLLECGAYPSRSVETGFNRSFVSFTSKCEEVLITSLVHEDIALMREIGRWGANPVFLYALAIDNVGAEAVSVRLPNWVEKYSPSNNENTPPLVLSPHHRLVLRIFSSRAPQKDIQLIQVGRATAEGKWTPTNWDWFDIFFPRSGGFMYRLGNVLERMPDTQ